MKVPLLDLKPQYRAIKQEIDREIEEVIDTQYFILGPKVQELEKDIAGYCNTEFAVGVSSGTDALLISLMADGVKAGDRVITTPYSFFATAGCITRIGATPVFVDIDPDTFNLSTEGLESAILDMSPEEKYSACCSSTLLRTSTIFLPSGRNRSESSRACDMRPPSLFLRSMMRAFMPFGIRSSKASASCSAVLS